MGNGSDRLEGILQSAVPYLAVCTSFLRPLKDTEEFRDGERQLANVCPWPRMYLFIESENG